ncbi:hypothetical protein DFH06DRAFT_1421965 [Mycena polygramma]|nr:hypothetical protein DFH06DRAFT_1421965 [Mycena polygramma]
MPHNSTARAFPPELERIIFEIAAELHPKLMPSLLRVASRVRVWIEPLLYNTLVFNGRPYPNVPPALLQTMSINPSICDRNVRNAIFWDLLDVSDAMPDLAGGRSETLHTVLSVCSGIQRLALWQLVPSMLPVLSTLRPQRLTIPHFVAIEDDKNVPIPCFTNVTHLVLLDEYSPDSILLSLIAALPSLTHLGINHNAALVAYTTGDLWLQILRNFTTLQRLLVMFMDRPGPRDVAEWAPDPYIVDPRFGMVVMDYAEYLEDWQIGVAGRRDFWILAEEFFVKKRMMEAKGEWAGYAYWYNQDF